MSDNVPDSSTGTAVHGAATISTVPAAAIPDARARAAAAAAEKITGPKAAELRAWQLAMLELARRHSMLQVCKHDIVCTTYCTDELRGGCYWQL